MLDGVCIPEDLLGRARTETARRAWRRHWVSQSSRSFFDSTSASEVGRLGLMSNFSRIGLANGVFVNVASLIFAGMLAVAGATATQTWMQAVAWGGMLFGLFLLGWGVTLDGEHWWRVWFSEDRLSARGFSAHAIVRLHQGQMAQRRYLFHYCNGHGSEVALYLSASEKLTFIITDATGEAYPLEIPPGWNGVPIGQFCYIYAEAAIYDQTTYLRLAINMKVVAKRRLSFPIMLAKESGEWEAQSEQTCLGETIARWICASCSR